MTSMLVIIAVVLLGTAFLAGVIVGAEVQKVVLRGHEGTRAEKLRELQRRREDSVERFRDRRYGPPLPLHRLSANAAPPHDRWWRRHPGGLPPEGRTHRAPPHDSSA